MISSFERLHQNMTRGKRVTIEQLPSLCPTPWDASIWDIKRGWSGGMGGRLQKGGVVPEANVHTQCQQHFCDDHSLWQSEMG